MTDDVVDGLRDAFARRMAQMPTEVAMKCGFELERMTLESGALPGEFWIAYRASEGFTICVDQTPYRFPGTPIPELV